MISLQNRLSAGLIASLVLLLGLQWLAVTWAIDRMTQSQLIDRLQHENESLLAGASFDAQGQVQVDAQRLSAVYQRPYSGHYFYLISGDRSLPSRSLWDARLDVPATLAGKRLHYQSQGPEGERLLVVVNGYRKQGRVLTVAVAEDMTPLQAGMTRFQIVYALLSLAGLLLLLGLQRVIVLRALRPLEQVQTDLARLVGGEIARIEARGPSEVMPLIDELNRLLAGIDRKTRRSRESLGNLAHALKTRLTLLNQIAESPDMAGHAGLRAALLETTQAMGQTIERELKRARLAGQVHPGRRVALPQAIGPLVDTLRRMYADKPLELAWSVAEDAVFIGDEEDLLELLGNLLDNACKWCRREVRLHVSGGDATRFVVEDDGPGCEAGALEALTTRGFRADEEMPGSGLGLAIVRDIVEGYGGTLTLSRASLGGLRAEASFPPGGIDAY